MARVHRRWWAVELWKQHYRRVPSGRCLYRPDSQGREAGRSAGAAGDESRIVHQSQDCQGARPYYANRSACARRRGDRVKRRPTADEVTLARKGANSPARGRKLRSTGTKAKSRVSNGPSLIELKKQLEARTRELAEAREQQRATSEVLQVISSSATELEPVFQAMLANAVHVCEAKFGSLFLCDGDLLRRVAGYNMPPELVTAMRKLNPRIYRVDQATSMARAVRTKQTVHIPDMKKQPLLDES